MNTIYGVPYSINNFTFDNIYSSYSDMIEQKKLDNILLGRYVYIDYDHNGSKNRIINQTKDLDSYKTEISKYSLEDFDGTVWRKILMPDENINFEFIAKVKNTMPKIKIEMTAPYPRYVINENGTENYNSEELFVKESAEEQNNESPVSLVRNDNTTYTIEMPKPWTIEMGDIDLGSDQIKQILKLNEKVEESDDETANTIALKPYSSIDGKKFADGYKLDVKLPILGKTIQEIYSILNGTDENSSGIYEAMKAFNVGFGNIIVGTSARMFVDGEIVTGNEQSSDSSKLIPDLASAKLQGDNLYINSSYTSPVITKDPENDEKNIITAPGVFHFNHALIKDTKKIVEILSKYIKELEGDSEKIKKKSQEIMKELGYINDINEVAAAGDIEKVKLWIEILCDSYNSYTKEDKTQWIYELSKEVDVVVATLSDDDKDKYKITLSGKDLFEVDAAGHILNAKEFNIFPQVSFSGIKDKDNNKIVNGPTQSNVDLKINTNDWIKISSEPNKENEIKVEHKITSASNFNLFSTKAYKNENSEDKEYIVSLFSPQFDEAGHYISSKENNEFFFHINNLVGLENRLSPIEARIENLEKVNEITITLDIKKTDDCEWKTTDEAGIYQYDITGKDNEFWNNWDMKESPNPFVALTYEGAEKYEEIQFMKNLWGYIYDIETIPSQSYSTDSQEEKFTKQTLRFKSLINLNSQSLPIQIKVVR